MVEQAENARWMRIPLQRIPSRAQLLLVTRALRPGLSHCEFCLPVCRTRACWPPHRARGQFR
jgi:hypothetical protein